MQGDAAVTYSDYRCIRMSELWLVRAHIQKTYGAHNMVTITKAKKPNPTIPNLVNLDPEKKGRRPKS